MARVYDEHLEAFIRGFATGNERQRLLALMSTAGGRKRLRRDLHRYFDGLEGPHVHQLPHEHTFPAPLYDLLRSKGAPEQCFVISEFSQVDGREMLLRDALEDVQCGTTSIVSCIPGKLAWLECELAKHSRLCERRGG